MKHFLLSLAAACMFCAFAHAQGTFVSPSSDGWQRTPSTQRQAEFPKVNADGAYWFRFQAPATAISWSAGSWMAPAFRIPGWNLPSRTDG